MAYNFAGQWGPETFIGQNTTTNKVTYATSCAVYQVGTTTPVALYTDKTKGTSASNPLAVNVTANAAGIDVNGNVKFFAVPGTYDLLINGTSRYTVEVVPDSADLAAAISPPDLSGLAETAGDNMTGDLTFSAGVGPVVTDTVTGAPVRLTVANGTLSLPAQPGAGANNSELVIYFDVVANAWPLRNTATLDPGQPVQWRSYVIGSGLPSANPGYAIEGVDSAVLRNA